MEFLLCPEMFVTGTSSDRERPSRVTETPPERPAKESPGANVLQLKSEGISPGPRSGLTGSAAGSKWMYVTRVTPEGSRSSKYS
jgi:hypothetical protein